MNRHVLLLIVTAILWSLGGVLIKSVQWNPLAISGSRSAVAVVVLATLFPALWRKISWKTLPGALAYTATVTLFVLATKLTTAANAIFLQYTAPIYIALLGPWLLQERATRLDWTLISLGLAGILLFFFDQLSLTGLLGVVFALASGVSYALMAIALRRERNGSPESVVLLGNLLTVLVAAPFMLPVQNLGQNLPWLLALGVIQLTIPYLTYSAAIRHVRALDASIISLIEPILNPIWVLIVMHERASIWTIVGGAVV
ncbi:MAG TPA: DMT family transporter, partial [Chthoniobacterales bacterium]|nr:DMT family transporter [Chthoniobacterales bacterium]